MGNQEKMGLSKIITLLQSPVTLNDKLPFCQGNLFFCEIHNKTKALKIRNKKLDESQAAWQILNKAPEVKKPWAFLVATHRCVAKREFQAPRTVPRPSLDTREQVR
jgi:hypothetical protein